MYAYLKCLDCGPIAIQVLGLTGVTKLMQVQTKCEKETNFPLTVVYLYFQCLYLLAFTSMHILVSFGVN